MDKHAFFMSHTYYAWDNFVPKQLCEQMTKEVFASFDKHYTELPSAFDSIVQKNTNHLEKQGYTRKYRAIYGDDVKALTSIYSYYTDPNVIRQLSEVAGCSLHTVPTNKTVDLAVQIYMDKGDGTNWHHDRSIFNDGRSFTFLTVIHNTSDQKLTVWTQEYGKEVLPWAPGKAVLIEKFKTYHSVTPLEYGERILLTLTYAEKPYYPTMLHPTQYILNKTKNYGYLGIDAFTPADYIVMFIILVIFILVIYYLYQKFLKKSPVFVRGRPKANLLMKKRK
jgi:hypothetical protein